MILCPLFLLLLLHAQYVVFNTFEIFVYAL
jgi:hypothetical protein